MARRVYEASRLSPALVASPADAPVPSCGAKRMNDGEAYTSIVMGVQTITANGAGMSLRGGVLFCTPASLETKSAPADDNGERRTHVNYRCVPPD